MSFNPRPPCGGRPLRTALVDSAPAFQSAPPVRGATVLAAPHHAGLAVSIRAPRAGGDEQALLAMAEHRQVSIRAPRAGGDIHSRVTSQSPDGFQSAPPVRGGDGWHYLTSTTSTRFQSAPPVRGATINMPWSHKASSVSIRAPRAGGDIMAGFNQSAPPVRGATLRVYLIVKELGIFVFPRTPIFFSVHAILNKLFPEIIPENQKLMDCANHPGEA